MHAYIVLSLLIGARTEELRALTWPHVDLDGKPATEATPASPPSIMVWRSVRAGADTKTKKSRRTLALPQRCADGLRAHRVRQEQAKQMAGRRWQDNELVFPPELAPRRTLLTCGAASARWSSLPDSIPASGRPGS